MHLHFCDMTLDCTGDFHHTDPYHNMHQDQTQIAHPYECYYVARKLRTWKILSEDLLLSSHAHTARLKPASSFRMLQFYFPSVGIRILFIYSVSVFIIKCMNIFTSAYYILVPKQNDILFCKFVFSIIFVIFCCINVVLFFSTCVLWMYTIPLLPAK